MHAEHRAWPIRSLTCWFGFYLKVAHLPYELGWEPQHFKHNSEFHSRNWALKTRAPQLTCVRVFFQTNIPGELTAPAEVPLQGEGGKRISPFHREAWSHLGCGNLLP